MTPSHIENLFAEKMAFLLPDATTNIAVACSGGSDSMALTLLARRHYPNMTALTVDHGLRAGSAEEARQVEKWLAHYGIAHHIFTWEGEKPASNIQEAARKARYQLMADYCHANRIAYLLVAHTLEDQAETFLLRLARGSGIDGLSAMAEKKQMYGITLLRPLLDCQKMHLTQYLDGFSQDYISDPSNSNTRYDRVKVRQMSPALAEIGLSAQKLANTARTMARAADYLEQQAIGFIAKQCQLFPEGYTLIHALPEHPEIALRVFKKIILHIGVQKMPPRIEDLERLILILPGDFKAVTLGGCIIRRVKHKIVVMREPEAVAGNILSVTGDKTIIWDRFTLSIAACTLQNLTVSALTQAGWLQVSKQYGLKNTYPDKRILYSLPCLRNENGIIIAVPHLGISTALNFTAQLRI